MAIRRLSNGLLAVEPRRKEFYGLIHQFLPLAAGTLGNTDNVQVDGQADFLIYSMAAAYDDGQAQVQFVVQPDRNLFSFPVWVPALGTGSFPKRYSAPFVIPRAQTFTCVADARQVVPADQSVRILHIGMKQYDTPFEAARAYQNVFPYDYEANFTSFNGGIGPVPSLGVLSYPINVFSDSDFDIYSVTVFSDGEATLQINSSGKALDWFNRPCHVALMGGTNVNAPIPSGGRPFTLPAPFRVPSSGSILITAADLSGAENQVQVIFHGLRMKPPGGLPVDPRMLV